MRNKIHKRDPAELTLKHKNIKMNIIKKLIGGAVNLMFPPHCLYCGNSISSLSSEKQRICPDCASAYSLGKTMKCGICQNTARDCSCGAVYLAGEDGISYIAPRFYIPDTLMQTISKADCGNSTALAEKGCRMTHDLVLRCKQSCNRELAAFLVRELAFDIAQLFSECGEAVDEWTVTYPPRSTANLIKLGFDHGEMLSAAAAELLGIPCVKTLCRGGEKYGAEQKTLSMYERYLNAENSLAPVKGAVEPGGKYILIDDIITTGATMAAAAEILLNCGAKTVLPAAVAKTYPKKS